MPFRWASHLLNIDSFVWIANKEIVIAPEKRHGFSTTQAGCGVDVRKLTAPVKPWLGFKVVISEGNHVNSAAYPAQGSSCAAGADREMTKNSVMSCVTNPTSPVWHTAFAQFFSGDQEFCVSHSRHLLPQNLTWPIFKGQHLALSENRVV